MKPTRFFLALGVLLLIGVVLIERAPIARAQSAPPVHAANPTYSLYCGLWRVDNGLVSTIHIKNALVVAPLHLTPVLYMSDGREYDLPPVELATAGTLDVNVNDALAKIPPTIHPSEYGSAELRYEYKNPGHLLASMEIINLHASLIFTYPFNAIDEDMPGTHTLEGVWWKHDPAVGGFVALTNLTGGVLQVEAQAIDSAGNWLPPQTFGVLAHSIQMLHLNALTAGLAESENQAGGLRLKYNGEMGALAVSGGLVNERRGYSAGIPFWYHDPDSSAPAAITYASAGVMIGQPDTMMGFPRSTAFTPYTVLRNTTAQSLPVKMTMNYMAEPKPISLSLPVAPLNPYETRKLDLPATLGALGLAKFRGDANLLFSFTGHAGDLVFATGSVDQTENYVFVVEPQGVGRSFGKAGHHWIFANDFDTMYSLFNPTDRSQDFIATIYYGDGSGSYEMPVHLEAQASTMIDMMMLIGEKRPDVHGNVIPSNVQQGSIVFESAKGKAQWMTLVVSGGVYNPRRGTCGPLTCISCYGYTNPIVVATSFSVGVQNTVNEYAQATYSDGTVQDFTGSSSWSSQNTSVMTVASGFVTGVSPGSTNITAQFPTLVVTASQICSSSTPTCPTFSPVPQSGGTTVDATPVITGIIPSDWNAGTTTQVTFTGQYFGTNAPSLSFSPSSGISYALSSYNDTQIVAAVTVATGTPNESVTVSVTNNGYGGTAFNGQSVGNSATSAPVNATVHSPINSVEITVIAWINGQAPDLNPLPSGANSNLINHLNNDGSAICGAEIAAWSILRIRADLQTSADVTYANAWLIKNSANGTPPSTISPSAQLLRGDFRLFHDFGNGGGAYQIGITPDPCGLNVPPVVLNWVGIGQASQYMGASGTSPSGKIYQLAEGRVGTMGQLGSQTINNGRTVPWVWSVIEFDSSGIPTYSDTAMFPTYSVYVNGGLLVTYNQSSVASFVANDQTYQRTPSQIP